MSHIKKQQKVHAAVRQTCFRHGTTAKATQDSVGSHLEEEAYVSGLLGLRDGPGQGVQHLRGEGAPISLQ